MAPKLVLEIRKASRYGFITPRQDLIASSAISTVYSFFPPLRLDQGVDPSVPMELMGVVLPSTNGRAQLFVFLGMFGFGDARMVASMP